MGKGIMNPISIGERMKKRIIWKYRERTSPARVLPEIIVIGAQKAGTTSLFYYLSQNPGLVPSVKKEVHYFDGGLDPEHDDFLRGEGWYKAHFPKSNQIKNSAIPFEATPSYLFHPDVPQRIHQLIPEVKMIVLLRNPTDRAISQYFHEKRKGREKLPILDAFEMEEERLKPILDNRDYKNSAFFRYSYKLRGLYFEQLTRYFNYFDRNQFLILNSEFFFSQTKTALEIIFNYIGVGFDPEQYDLGAKHVSKNKETIDQEVYSYLDNYFKSQNEKLFELLGEKYSW